VRSTIDTRDNNVHQSTRTQIAHARSDSPVGRLSVCALSERPGASGGSACGYTDASVSLCLPAFDPALQRTSARTARVDSARLANAFGCARVAGAYGGDTNTAGDAGDAGDAAEACGGRARVVGVGDCGRAVPLASGARSWYLSAVCCTVSNRTHVHTHTHVRLFSGARSLYCSGAASGARSLYCITARAQSHHARCRRFELTTARRCASAAR
jgi:hypothetical protein